MHVPMSDRFVFADSPDPKEYMTCPRCQKHVRDVLHLIPGEDLARCADCLFTYIRTPVPLILCCPMCGARHIDEDEFAIKAHHTHSCQSCGFTWRPAVVPTVGVQFLPGFKTEKKT